MSKPIRFSETVILEISLKPFKQTDVDNLSIQSSGIHALDLHTLIL